MERPLALLVCTLLLGSLVAQRDSSAVTPRPWIEAMAGIRCPAGVAGVGAGFPLGQRIMPAVAIGLGGSEGMNYSLGCEVRLGGNAMTVLRGFAYWSYTGGSRNEEDPRFLERTGAGQMVKVGAAFVIDLSTVDLVVRAGYAGFVEEPERTEIRSGVAYPAARDPYFNGGLSAGFGVAVPLGRSR